MADFYHRSGGHGNHRGGPHPGRIPKSAGKQSRKLAMEAGATPMFPNGQRPLGRTLAAALHSNAHLQDMDPRFKIGKSDAIATRVGRPPPLVAGPARVRRPR